MTSLVDLIELCSGLSKLFKSKTPPIIPQNVLDNSLEKLDSLITTLRAYFPPDTAEKRAAKAHPISTRIIPSLPQKNGRLSSRLNISERNSAHCQKIRLSLSALKRMT